MLEPATTPVTAGRLPAANVLPSRVLIVPEKQQGGDAHE